jgi:rhamnulokinase
MVDVRTGGGRRVLSAQACRPRRSWPDDPGSSGEAVDPGSRPAADRCRTHDTASAFVGTPVPIATALILSLGTWALIGAEATGVTPTDESRRLNVTHELGVDGTVRLLRNVCGMWLLEECRRAWALEDGVDPSVPDLLSEAERAPAFAAILDVDHPALARPGQSPRTIEPHVVGSWTGTKGAVVRTILESLVARLATRADEIETLLGTHRPVIHVVGGASRMALVMQWLADATGKRVVAGPVEATALGNAVVQWRTRGVVADLADARAAIARMPEIRTFEPIGSRQPWLDFAARLKESP